jgi:hypothetical protein
VCAGCGNEGLRSFAEGVDGWFCVSIVIVIVILTVVAEFDFSMSRTRLRSGWWARGAIAVGIVRGRG